MTATRIDIATDDGSAPAYRFGPPGGPAVLVFIDAIGMRPAMRELGERLGAEGYQVVMPDLFWRLGAYTAPDAMTLMADPAARSAWFAAVMPAGAAPHVLADTRAYLAHFGEQPVAITGYCMGGRLAILAAAAFPERVAAVAAYHPGGLVSDAPESPHRQVGAIAARVYVGGASDDATFTDEQRGTFAAALATAGVAHDVELYAAKHGWVPSDTPVHDVAATARHWETLLALLRHTIG